jgi:hypothetical protein
MRFGGTRAPARLLAGRAVVYLQAAELVIIAGWAGLAAIIGSGAVSTGELSTAGLFSHAQIQGGGLIVFGLIQVAIAGLLVYVAREAEINPASYRSLLTAAEAGLVVYLLGFVNLDGGTLIFGLLFGATVVTLHWWPELAGWWNGVQAGGDPPVAALAAPAGGPIAHPTEAAAEPAAPAVLPAEASPMVAGEPSARDRVAG